MRFLLALVLIGAVSPAWASGQVDKYLKENQKDYPECVRVVRNQLFILPPETHIAMLPHLLEACKSGRAIGEKRNRKFFLKKKEPEDTN